MSDSKTVAVARVKVMLEIDVSGLWGEDCTIAQAKRQAKDSAAMTLDKLLRGHRPSIRAVGELEPVVIITQRDAEVEVTEPQTNQEDEQAMRQFQWARLNQKSRQHYHPVGVACTGADGTWVLTVNDGTQFKELSSHDLEFLGRVEMGPFGA